MADDDLPFRCRNCGAFVGQQRGHEADDHLPAPCKRCATRRLADDALTARTTKNGDNK